LEPEVAKQLANGDIDPVDLEPMVDINPGFNPRSLNKVPTTTVGASKKAKGKEVAGKLRPSGGLHDFFGMYFLLLIWIPAYMWHRSERRHTCPNQDHINYDQATTTNHSWESER
jgi:hypothetical protein